MDWCCWFAGVIVQLDLLGGVVSRYFCTGSCNFDLLVIWSSSLCSYVRKNTTLDFRVSVNTPGIELTRIKQVANPSCRSTG